MPATLWVDSRTGSKELLPGLRKAGITAELATLDSGDFAFEGRGPDEHPISIAVERKTIPDLVASLQSGRLQGVTGEGNPQAQLYRLKATYDFVWLLVEGLWETDKFGRLVRRGLRGTKPLPGCHMTADGLTKSLVSLEVQGGLNVRQTASQAQSEAFLVALFRWWTEKAWDAHTTLKTQYSTHHAVGTISRFREATMKIGGPDVGLVASLAAETYFQGSLARLLRSTEAEWANLPLVSKEGSKRLGKAKAARIVQAIEQLNKGAV